MEKIKSSTIKGIFFPEDEKELKSMIAGYKKSQYPEKFRTRAVIVPHAGLVYSGKLAYQGLSLLNFEIKKVFIIAPAHKTAFTGIAVSDYETFETPLGKINVDKTTIKELNEKFNAQYKNEAFDNEHSIEIQLPLIQTLFKNLKIIPVLVGAQTYDLISKIIENYYDNTEYGFIISSDLSHFLPDDKARAIDTKTAEMIESGNLAGFKHEQACGAVGIAGLVRFAVQKGFSMIRAGMMNSGEIADKTKVVGYGAWALYEGSQAEFIKKYFFDFTKDLVKQSIESKFKTENTNINYPPVFNTLGASFVTINKNNLLRGCIGSVIAHRPLILDITANARNAAFADPRFKPVEKGELTELTYAISLLSKPVKIEFKDEKDLLSKMQKDIDGIIIKDMDKQAVYLPCVWEQLPDKKEFLNSLKQKAGLSKEHFSKTFEAYRFKAEYIK